MLMDANGGLWLTHPGIMVAFGVAVFLVFGWAHGLVSLDERESGVVFGMRADALANQAVAPGARRTRRVAGEPRTTHLEERRGPAPGRLIAPAGRRTVLEGDARPSRRYGRTRANSVVS